jgi:ElaB/YqjD/DUF883 family membrane-anchored ribosome-binding protein
MFVVPCLVKGTVGEGSMAHTDDELEQSIEETRQDIEEKRTAMAEKLELLEERFRDTLEETRSAVEEIVENVKGTVDDTVGVVKETVEGAKSTVDNLVENVKGTMDDTATLVKKSFDLNYQIEQRPWVMLGGSVLVGWMLGNWMTRGSSYQRAFFERGYYYDYDEEDDTMYTAPMRNESSHDDLYETEEDRKSDYDSHTRSGRPMSSSYTRPRRWSNVTSQFQEEWDALKGIAVGTLMGTLRSMVRQHMPSVAPKLEQAINSASAKLGAEPIEVSSQQPHAEGHKGQSQSHQGSTSDYRNATATTAETQGAGWQGSQTGTSGSTPRGQYR